MGRIAGLFSALRESNKKGFIAYITAGDPSIDFTERLIPVLEKAGVDLLEIGVPFSDPLADGPVIQEASCRALQEHTNLNDIFAMIKRVRAVSDIPMILFTYLNPVYQFGMEKFARCAADAGIDGALILDLPPEESDDYRKMMEQCGLDTIFIISPTTSERRMKLIADASTGFIYYVSRAGVTGEQAEVAAELGRKMRDVRAVTNKPVAIGFGVSNPEQVATVAQHGDAVVVGSAIVRRINDYHSHADGLQRISDYVSSLTEPLS